MRRKLGDLAKRTRRNRCGDLIWDRASVSKGRYRVEITLLKKTKNIQNKWGMEFSLAWRKWALAACIIIQRSQEHAYIKKAYHSADSWLSFMLFWECNLDCKFWPTSQIFPTVLISFTFISIHISGKRRMWIWRTDMH